MELSTRLQKLRNNAQMTQERLAEKLQISRQSIAKWEKGESLPDINHLVHISELFNVSIDYLLKGPNEYSHGHEPDIDEIESFKHFLCKAKKNTYAAHGAERSSSRPHSHDLFYQENSYAYWDSYFGGEKFAGQEVLYVKDDPYWSMNYAGRVLDHNFSGDFLKKSLRLVKANSPYRGPGFFQEDSFSYHCKIKGDFDWFTGEEEIFFETIKVYECMFQGSMIG